MSKSNGEIAAHDDSRNDFVIPLTEDEFALVPERIRQDVALVAQNDAEGVQHSERSDDIRVVAGITNDRLNKQMLAIISYAEAYIQNLGIPFDRLHDSYRRLVEAATVKEVPDLDLLKEVLPNIVDKLTFGIRLALEEVLVNCAKHGNKGKPLPFGGSYQVQNDVLVIETWDSGKGWDPTKVADPTLDENKDVPCGRGMLLAKSYMDWLEEQNGEGPIVTGIRMGKQIGGFDDQQLDTLVTKGVEAAMKERIDEKKKERAERVQKLLAEHMEEKGKVLDAAVTKPGWKARFFRWMLDIKKVPQPEELKELQEV